MTDEQREHLASIQLEFNRLVQAKYEAGAKEHGSTLSRDYTAEQLLDMLLEELIDGVVYGLTLREALRAKERE